MRQQLLGDLGPTPIRSIKRKNHLLIYQSAKVKPNGRKTHTAICLLSDKLELKICPNRQRHSYTPHWVGCSGERNLDFMTMSKMHIRNRNTPTEESRAQFPNCEILPTRKIFCKASFCLLTKLLFKSRLSAYLSVGCGCSFLKRNGHRYGTTTTTATWTWTNTKGASVDGNGTSSRDNWRE